MIIYYQNILKSEETTVKKTKTVKKSLAFALVTASLVCLFVLSASAYSGTAYGNTGIYYSINSDGEAVITDAKSYIETADIPESINGRPVTRIEGFAFRDCTSLLSVTIPNSVTGIGSSAFSGCTALSGVTIPKSVTSIGDYVFKDCTGLTEINWYAENVKDFSPYNAVFSNAGTSGDGIDIAFGNSVKSIPAYLFYGIGSNPYKTPKIKTVTIGKGVTSIGISAFRECTLVSSIVIPNSVTSIGSSAFNGCTSLSGVTVPNGVTSIGHYTFMDCDELKSITLPSSLKSVGKQAFDIDSVNLHISDLAAWCNIEFKGVVSTSKYKLHLKGNRITNLVIPDGVTSVGDYAFGNCDGLTRITIPNGVTSVGQSAFVGCPFAEIKIGKDLKSIGNNAFAGITAVPELYYAGSEDEWSKISLDSTNGFIQSANMHYNADIIHKHSNKEVINKKETCTANGAKTLTCDCGNNYISVIPALGHKYKTTATKATTSKNGSAIIKCTTCQAVKAKSTIARIASVKLSKTSLTYNGKTQKPTVTVKDSKGNKLKNGTDYTVKYSKGCKNVGQYTVTITFKGNYAGTKTLTYKILPKGTSISKLTAGKKQFTAKWTAQTAQTTGYELQYSTSSSMSGAKTVTVGKNKTTSAKVKKLKGKKKYYVRVRTYKTVKINGKNVKLYSAWSKVKSVKTK